MPHLSLLMERMNTPIGQMLLVTDEHQRVRALDWHDHEDRLHLLMQRQYRGDTVMLNTYSGTSPAALAMQAYFEGDLQIIDTIAIATGGTDFQRTVWKALRDIIPGTPISYAALAEKIGKPSAVRAVGLANGANPVGIIVPCHRVIGSDRSLTGYGGGLERKKWLLNHELPKTTAGQFSLHY